MFYAGQEVECVDDSPAANPWHQQFPLVKHKIYIVQALAGPYCINIDVSGRAWQNWRFRPLYKVKTKVSFTEGAPIDSKKWDNRKKVRVVVRNGT